MAGQKNVRILAGRPAVDFVGQTHEAERLITHARSRDGLLLLATPGTGASELLKQAYDRLFHEHQEVIPFYFSIRRAFTSGHEVAESFLNEFIRQVVAFRRRDGAVVRSAADLDELAELSLSVSGIWIDRMIETARTASEGRAYIRNRLAAPIRAAAHDARTMVMIDGVHAVSNIDGGISLFEELKDIFDGCGVSFVFSGYRRFLHGQMNCGRLELDNLGFDDAGSLIEVFAKENSVAISESSRDLIEIGG